MKKITLILSNSESPEDSVCILISAQTLNLRTGKVIFSDDMSELHSDEFSHLFDDVQIMADYSEGITIDQFKNQYL